ncbi:hypothetical protein Dsin_015146 [Dipteronia sinensis]|uniref:Ubiquitin-like protease family profile domain-containing protein n=1 Tax=Dipteronia sinensis TaxID=43782 RepID=A0AAE0E4Q8_9ROSI|nr:hypothetical protein Dsin_015146 [Dipteronia sinensis]
MALVLFANNILFGQDYRRQVTYWLLSLVEDIEAFNLFPWGHYVFKMTLHYIRIGFKFWAMEAIQSMRKKLGNRFAPQGSPRFKKWEFIKRGSHMSESWLKKELEGKITLGIDDDLSEGPQFVPLKDLGNKEDGNERGGQKRNRYRGPDEPIKRRRNLRDMSQPRHTTREDSDRRTTRDDNRYRDRGIPVEDPHSPVQHPSSGDNQRTPSLTRHVPPSPTRQRPPSLTPQRPPYHRTRHSSARGSTYTAIPNQLLDQVHIIVREEVQTAMEFEFAKFRADFFKMFSNQIPSGFSTEDYAEHDDSDGEPAFQLNTGLGVYAWLGNDHVDAYINLLCKRKQDPVQGQSSPCKVAVLDCAFFESLSSIWRKFQPNFHRPLPKPFYPKDFEVPTDLIIYATGEKPAWGTPWADVDDVLVPCNLGDNHWVLCVVRLNDWVITIFDSNAHLQPNYPRYREHQVLPLRRLFPLICKASGYYDGLEYVMKNKDPNFDFNQDNIPAFRKQMARDIFANSLPFH